MKKMLLISGLAFISVGIAFAQEKVTSEKAQFKRQLVYGQPDTTLGKIRIYSDERVHDLVEKYARLSEEKEIPTYGYCVQIASASGNNARDRVNDVKAQFLMSYPDMPAYLLWDSPNYKIRVGDFRTQLEAENFQVKIEKEFPYAFTVWDEIEFPSLEKLGEEE